MTPSKNGPSATIREVHQLLKETREEILSEVRGLGGRVSSLEKWRWRITGAVAVLATGVPVLVAVLSRA